MLILLEVAMESVLLVSFFFWLMVLWVGRPESRLQWQRPLHRLSTGCTRYIHNRVAGLPTWAPPDGTNVNR